MAALRASYHRILNSIEHVLPEKLKPIYNHPAGKSDPGNMIGRTESVLTAMSDALTWPSYINN